MTLETPSQRSPLHRTHSLPGWGASIQMLGGDGMIAVSASRIQAQSPVEAALAVMKIVTAEWSKADGPLKMLSWSAHRDRVLVGSNRGGWDSGDGWDYVDDGFRPGDGDGGSDGDDPGGSAGVREPRRPLPGPSSLHAAAELPGR
jgi:hypothetical protein